MKLVIDACVLYPSVLREVVFGAAKAGLFTPLWSERILGEWTHAVARLGPVQAMQAKSEAAVLAAQFPKALVPADTVLEAQLYLPDPNDRHVFATAITAAAEGILTLNLKDFPTRSLAEYGVSPIGPDAYFYQIGQRSPEILRPVTDAVHAQAQRLLGEAIAPRALYKKARLPRMAKLFYGPQAAQ